MTCPFQRCSPGVPGCAWCLWAGLRAPDDHLPVPTALERFLEALR